MPSSILSSKSVVAAQNLTLAATPLASLTTKITSCQVSPTLPPGLLLDASTCSLTGAPATAIASPSLYQVKIVDQVGNSETVSLSLTISPDHYSCAYTASYINSSSVYGFQLSANSQALFSAPGMPLSPGRTVSLATDPQSKFAVVSVAYPAGLASYSIDPNTCALNLAPGSPYSVVNGYSTLRYVLLHPNRKFVYALDDGGNQVFGFTIDPVTYALTAMAGSPWPCGSPLSGTITNLGKYLYVSNGNALTGFAIDSATGALTAVTGSPFAIIGGLNFYSPVIDAADLFLALTDYSANLTAIWKITAGTGTLTQAPGSPYTEGGHPGAPIFSRNSQFFYVPDSTSGQLLGYSINQNNAALTVLAGLPLAVSTHGISALLDPTGQYFLFSDGTANSTFVYKQNSVTGSLTSVAGSPFVGVEAYFQSPSGRDIYATNITNQLVHSSFDLLTGSVTAGSAIAGPPAPIYSMGFASP